MTKKLFIFFCEGKDSTHYNCYTFNEVYANSILDMHKNGLLNEYDFYSDSYGLCYETLTVPNTCTADSLGITLFDDWYIDEFCDGEK